MPGARIEMVGVLKKRRKEESYECLGHLLTGREQFEASHKQVISKL